MSDYDVRIVSRIVDALTWEMDASDVVEGVLEQIGVDDVLEAITLKDIQEYLGENKAPDQVFTHEELEEWARENLNELCDDDPHGYEEEERY